MSVSWYAIVVLSLLVYIPSWRIAFRWMTQVEPTWDASLLFLCIMTTSMMACIVPVVLPFRLLFLLAKRLTGEPDAATVARVLAGESRASKAKRLQVEKAQREAYIKQLERELEIH